MQFSKASWAETATNRAPVRLPSSEQACRAGETVLIRYSCAYCLLQVFASPLTLKTAPKKIRLIPAFRLSSIVMAWMNQVKLFSSKTDGYVRCISVKRDFYARTKFAATRVRSSTYTAYLSMHDAKFIRPINDLSFWFRHIYDWNNIPWNHHPTPGN